MKRITALVSSFKTTHQPKSNVWVMAGGRGRKVTSVLNLSWQCYKLHLSLLSLPLHSACSSWCHQLISPSGQRAEVSPQLRFWLAFCGTIWMVKILREHRQKGRNLAAVFILKNYTAVSCIKDIPVNNHKLWQLWRKQCFPEEYQSQVGTSPFLPSLPVSHDVQIHSSVTPGSCGLSAGR